VREGEGALSESERDELNRLLKENAALAMHRRLQHGLADVDTRRL
jgi:hypothetical protein